MLIYSRYVFIYVKTYCLKNSRRSFLLTAAVCLPMVISLFSENDTQLIRWIVINILFYFNSNSSYYFSFLNE